MELPLFITSIIKTVVDVWDLIKKHPYLSLTILVFFTGWSLYEKYVIVLPSNSIRSYYRSIDNEFYDEAWKLFTKEYKENEKRAWNKENLKNKGFPAFKHFYETSNFHTNIQINSLTRSIINYLKIFREDTRVYKVNFDVRERFTRDTLLSEGYNYNKLCVNISYKQSEFDNFIENGYIENNGIKSDKLEIQRTFHKKFTLKKVNNNWLIDDIKGLAITIHSR